MKTKTGAVLLAFFFTGDLGAHGFYLCDMPRGWFYVKGWAIVWALWGVDYVFTIPFSSPNVGVLPGVVACFGTLVLLVCRGWDFFHLPAMHPIEFEARFNA